MQVKQDGCNLREGQVENSNIVDSRITTITFDPPIAVAINNFAAYSRPDGIELTWDISMDETIAGFALYRAISGTGTAEQINNGELLPSNLRTYLDCSAAAEVSYRYQLAVVMYDRSEITSSFVTAEKSAASFTLLQNYPNSFNPSTTIQFVLDRTGPVTLSLHDVSGARVRKLVDRIMEPGTYTEEWDGCDENGHALASGIYFYRLHAGKNTLIRKAVLLK